MASLGERGTVVFGLAFDAMGKRLATAGSDGRLRIFAMPQGTLVTNIAPVEVRRVVGGR